MRDHGYDKGISLGVSGSSAIIGPIIPPSVPIIIYAVLAEESIGELFLAGIVPGLLLGLLLMVLVYALVVRREYDAREPFDPEELKDSFIGAAAAILTPLIIVLGILSGYFTATEAGAVSVVYVILVGIAYGELTPGGLYRELRDSAVETFSLTFIVAVAALYGLIALQLQLPTLLAEGIGAVTTDPVGALLLIVLLLLVVGTFMETIAAITILVPILLPVIELTGIDPVHFGIVMILTLMLGLLTPPFGVILFVLEKVTDASLEEVMRAVVPFYLPILVVLLLVVLFPGLATYVPGLMPG